MDESTARERLHSRLSELAEDDRISAADRAPVKLDQDSVGRLSRMDAIQVQAMALAAERRRHGERQRIERALKRLEEGEWGYCVLCGERIAEARLENDPSVGRCIKCASGVRP